MMKKLCALSLVLALLLMGCAEDQPEPNATTQAPDPNNTIGICLPDFDWSSRGAALAQRLEAEGYDVMVENAVGDAQLQYSQVETFVNMPVGCLVVTAIDSMALGSLLSDAQKEGVPVLALDRMLMYTDGVAGCVAMDSYEAGRLLGSYIVQQKQLDTAEKPVTVEFFMGSPENNNSLLLYQGLMEQLQPYLQKGKLKCLSGRTAFEDTCILPETVETASERCFDYLADFYTSGAPDVLCAANDTLAAGCIEALTSFGMEPGEDWPLVTGGDCTADTVGNLAEGYQSISLYTDLQAMEDTCVQWICRLMEEQTLDADTVSNGLVQVPVLLQTPVIVTAENYREFFPE